jgi:hypothetical protein
MAGVVPDVGETLFARYIVGKTAPGAPKLHLFTNDVTPGEATVLGDLTEATANGTAAKTLTSANWTVADGAASYAQQTFTITQAEPTVYGYYITDNAGTGLLAAERFADAPYVIPAGGGSILITPTLTVA